MDRVLLGTGHSSGISDLGVQTGSGTVALPVVGHDVWMGPGTYSLEIVADDGGGVTEADEWNNSEQTSIWIDAPYRSALIDLSLLPDGNDGSDDLLQISHPGLLQPLQIDVNGQQRYHNAYVDRVRILGSNDKDDFTGAWGVAEVEYTFSGQGGDDTLYLPGNARGDVTFNGGAGNDGVALVWGENAALEDAQVTVPDGNLVSLSSVEKATITGTPQDDSFELSAWSGAATLDGLEGQDTLYVDHSGALVLTQGSLARTGAGTLALAGIENVELTGSDLVDQFIVDGWAGELALAGGEGADRLELHTNVALAALYDDRVEREGHPAISLTAIEQADVVFGDADNVLDVGSWSGSGTIDGGGGEDRLESERSGEQRVQALLFRRSGGGDLTFANVENVQLAGQAGPDQLEVTDWPGTALLEGGRGSDGYTVGLLGSGSGNTTIVEETLAGNDSLTVNAPAPGIPVTYESTRVFGGNEVVLFGKELEDVVVNAASDVALGGTDVLLDVEPSRNVNVVNTATVGTGSLLTIGGTVSAGNLVNQGEIQLGGHDSRIGGSTLTNAGLLLGTGEVSAALSNSAAGEIRVGQGAELRLGGAGGTNYGAIHLDGGHLVLSESFNNAPTGFIAGRGGLDAVGGLVNDGTMAFSGGTMNLYGQLQNQASGRVVVSGGSSLVVHDDLTHTGAEIRTGTGRTVVYASDVQGSAPFTGPGNSVFQADLRPGNSTAAVAFVGDVVFQPTTRLEIELGGVIRGDEYDAVDVGGTITLGGTLAIGLTGGFVPKPGDTFQIATFGARNGAFAAVEGLDLGAGPVFDVTWTDTALTLVAVDDDVDGVSDIVEDNAPNGGDGNGDGTPDSQQPHVTSVPNSETGTYLTLTVPDTTGLAEVSTPPNPSPADAPQGIDFPIGFIDFTVAGVDAGGATSVTIYTDPGAVVTTYYKYGPTPADPSPHWYEFLYDGTTGAEFFADRIVLHFIDGQRGDDDLAANGDVVDVGAPGTAAEIAARFVFYNNSAFDGQDDAAAIASDKFPLRPGATAGLANYTSYTAGINGIMVDIADLLDGAVPEATDFEFHVGNDDTPGDWPAAVEPESVTFARDAGIDDSDRVTIVFPDGAIRNTWLQVTLKKDNLGLTADDVFYFGNAVAEAGNSVSDAKVTTTDLLLARNNPRDFTNRADVAFSYDYNRDTFVNATDVLLARNNQTSFFDALRLIDLSGSTEESPVPDSVWLSEFDWTAASRQPAENDAAAKAVDTLLATYWPE